MGQNAVTSRSVEQVLQTLLGFDAGYLKHTLKLNHLQRRSIEFISSTSHNSPNGLQEKGLLAIRLSLNLERILGSPSLQGDHKAVKPVGAALNFVVSAIVPNLNAPSCKS